MKEKKLFPQYWSKERDLFCNEEFQEHDLKEDNKFLIGLIDHVIEMMSTMSGDPFEECPFCMNELFDKDEMEKFKKIKEAEK